SHPYFSLNDPNSPVLTPDIWASWNSMQREAGVPVTPAPTTSSRALLAAIARLEKTTVAATLAGSNGTIKALAEWLADVAKVTAAKGDAPIIIELPPPEPVVTSGSPASRR